MLNKNASIFLDRGNGFAIDYVEILYYYDKLKKPSSYFVLRIWQDFDKKLCLHG